MRKILTNIVFILLSVSGFAQFSQGQPRIHISTVQTLYVVGETVEVSIFVDSLYANEILFADLISSENSWIIGAKYEIIKPFSTINFKLPDQLVSGIYLLRVYNAFNKTPNAEVERIAIKVVNPYDSKVLASDIISKNSIATEHGINRMKSNASLIRNAGGDSLIFTMDRNQMMDNQCVSISMAPSYATQEIPFEMQSHTNVKSAIFLEDGLVLSGKIYSKITGKPLPHQGIHLVIPELKNIFFATSDSSGLFHFNLAYSTGIHQIYINLQDTLLADEALIDVDRDFLPAERFATIPFSLDSIERANILRRVQYMEVLALFARVQHPQKEVLPFYGHADKMIVLDEYVDLFTLKDFFKEVPGNVNLKKEKGHYQIRLDGDNPQMEYLKPLVLLDYIPVYNFNKILELNISKIYSYEIVNEVYVRDDKIFGGVLNIISRRNDFANYKFPASAQFVPFTLLSDQNSMPVIYDSKHPKFVKPILLTNLSTDSHQKDCKLTFPLPQDIGNYIFQVIYISNSGKAIVEKKKITVD